MVEEDWLSRGNKYAGNTKTRKESEEITSATSGGHAWSIMGGGRKRERDRTS